MCVCVRESVCVCIQAQYAPDLPAVGVLRLLRIFRILKLFQRLSSLRIIINALLASIMPVMNAFVVLFLITAIYAVVATMFFYKYDTVQFGKFSSSLYTMFQVHVNVHSRMCSLTSPRTCSLTKFSSSFYTHVSGVHW